MALSPTVKHGKLLVFKVDSISYSCKNWSLSPEVEHALIKHSELATDANGESWPNTLLGFTSATGEATLIYDFAALPTTALKTSTSGIGFFGYTSTVKFQAAMVVTGYKTGADVDSSNPDEITFTFQLTGAPTYPS